MFDNWKDIVWTIIILNIHYDSDIEHSNPIVSL